MTLPMHSAPGNPAPFLNDSDRSVLLSSGIDPAWALAEYGVHSEGCNLRFPLLGMSTAGIVRHCTACRESGRPKYQGPAGHTPQPTLLHDAGPGSAVLYVEGVLKSLCAAAVAHAGSLQMTVVFINGCDGIGAATAKTVGAQVAGRGAVVVFDADLATNPDVAAAARRVEGHLRRAGAASVVFPRVPRVADDASTGLDDYLASLPVAVRPGTLDALVRSAEPDLLAAGVFETYAAGLSAMDRIGEARRITEHVCSLGLGESWILQWRTRLKESCGLPLGEFDAVRRDTEKRARDRGRERAQAAVKTQGPEMPSPTAPLEVAHAVLELHPDWHRTVCIWRGDWYAHMGTHWAAVPATTMTDRLRRDLRHAWYMGTNGREPGPVPWAPTTGKINEVVDALASVLRRPDTAEPDTGIFAQNGRVNLDGSVSPHDPSVFNLSVLGYAYDPGAVCPTWEGFLATSLPDPDDQRLLREVMGYLIGGDTNQQSIFFLSGPPGGGKGTVMRAVQSLLGKDSFTSTSLAGLASHFGKASLIGKSVAFLPDVRFNTAHAKEALEPLLSISGEDSIHVPRKNRDDWVGQIPARLVMASNDLPSISDHSAALFRRLVVVRFTQSFEGREDRSLDGRIREELPGILRWALAGYVSLLERGRFKATASGYQLAQEARREASPVAAFIEDRCVMEPGAYVTSAELYAAWTVYKGEEGFTRLDFSRPGLTRAVCSAAPGLVPNVQRKVEGRNTKVLTGIRIADDYRPMMAPGTVDK